MLPFSEQAKCQFDRVATKHGFSCVLVTEQCIRYESEDVFFDVNFDNGRSYELGIEIGQILPGKIERPFSLAEILRLKNAQEADIVDGMSASNPVKLVDDLRFLADLSLKYAADFLQGNDLSFAQIARLREKESMAYAIERDLRSARARAETAWESKNYKGVISALEPVEPYLSPAEIKRLKYSLKKLSA